MRHAHSRLTSCISGFALVGLLAGVEPVDAMPILPGAGTTFDAPLFDHEDGALTASHGPYGLRYDVLDPPVGAGPTFSMEFGNASATLRIFSSGDAQLFGTLHRNDTAEDYSVVFNLTGLVLSETGYNYRWTSGSGTLIGPGVAETLLSEQNGAGHAFNFLPDGHRLANDTTTFVGRGWLLPQGSTDDFLFKAQWGSVPEPSVLLLFGAGLAGVAYRRRRHP